MAVTVAVLAFFVSVVALLTPLWKPAWDKLRARQKVVGGVGEWVGGKAAGKGKMPPRPNAAPAPAREPWYKQVHVYISILTGLIAILGAFRACEERRLREPMFRDVYYNAYSATITGSVNNLNNPEDYSVVLFLETPAGWQVIPQSTRGEEGRLATVQSSASFSIRSYREGCWEEDRMADRYTVFLIRSLHEGQEQIMDYDGAGRVCVDRYEQAVPPPRSGPGPGEEDAQPAFEDVRYDPEAKQVVGRVAGLTPESREDYHLLFFIHTNNWYIKPEFGEGARQPIGEDGTFRIPAYRGYPDELRDEVTGYAVFLVPAGYEGPRRQTDYDAVKNVAVCSYEVPPPEPQDGDDGDGADK